MIVSKENQITTPRFSHTLSGFLATHSQSFEFSGEVGGGGAQSCAIPDLRTPSLNNLLPLYRQVVESSQPQVSHVTEHAA